MSRKPKTTDYQKNVIRRTGFEHDNFFRIYRSLYESEPFLALPSTAKVIYIAIALQAGREDIKTMECCFPESQYTDLGFTKKQVIPAVDVLEQYGFIEVERYKSRRPNRYRLSDRWQRIKISDLKGTVK